MLNKIKLSLQYILPKQFLTELAGWGASKRAGWLTKAVIDLFAKYYNVDMKEAQNPDTASYRTFNEFFVRALRDGVRPVDNDPNTLIMPADGVISQSGPIAEDQLLQAKGHTYSLEALLAGNYPMADLFRNGTFATTYLSPRDYHRVHMPCNGILREMIYVPGSLFSVNPLTAQNVPNLFARNERVICLFDTEFGPMAQILVGATIVGSIETVWSGTITPPRTGVIKRWTWPAGDTEGCIALLKGQEMGRFKLGSTVINLFAPGKVNLLPHLQNRPVTRLGEALGLGALPAETPEPVTPEAPAPRAALTAAEATSTVMAAPDVASTLQPVMAAPSDALLPADAPEPAPTPEAHISAQPSVSESVSSSTETLLPVEDAEKPDRQRGNASAPASRPQDNIQDEDKAESADLKPKS